MDRFTRWCVINLIKMTSERLSEWNRWFEKFVRPIFISEERENYYAKLQKFQAPFYPKYWIAEKFYIKIKNDDRFDDELKMYFSFLYSCGFFMEYVIEFEEWLEMGNWEKPFQQEELTITIMEILKLPNGINLLKEKLRWLPFINRQEGA